MKKNARIVLPLLLVAVMLITALSVFTLTAVAADTSEATLRGYTITYGTTTDNNGNETGTTAIAAATTSSFANLAASLADLSPEVASRYVLNINKDITVDTPFVISGNELTEVWINLNGHTITSTVDGPMFTAAGTGAKIRFFGGNNKDGSYGAFKSTAANASFVKIAAGSDDYVDIYNVDFTFGANADGTAMFIAEGGKINVEHSNVVHALGNRASFFDVKDATLNLKYSRFEGGKGTTLVKASASDVYIEGGYMIGYALVDSDATASNIIIAAHECEVDTAFIQGSADTKTYVLGSVMEIYTAIASGEANAENLVFYYGDGSMSVIGQDFSRYGIADSDVFSVTESGGVWTMSHSSTKKAMATVAVMGSAPVTALYDTPDKALETTLGGVSKDMRGATVSTVRIVTLLNDYSSGASNCTNATYYGCENASLIFDFNGHTLTYASSDTTGSTLLSVSHDMHVTIDGSDIAGNFGSYVTQCRYARLVYARQSSKQGQISYHLVNVVKDLNVVTSGLWYSSAATTPIIGLTAGYGYIENVKLSYTGEHATEANIATSSAQMISLGHSSFQNGVVYMDGVTVSSTSTNSIKIYALVTTESWKVFADNCKTEGVETVASVGAKAFVNITNSTLKSDDVVFSDSGKVFVTDTAITTATGTLCSGSIVPTLYYGTGKTVINTGSNVLSGSAATEEGYSLSAVSDGVYKVVSGSNAHTLTMPAVFSNGMMLQRDKVVNVYGYCQDIGATVRVTIGDKTSDATVGEDGRWSASFAPMAAAYNVTITIKQLGKGIDGVPDIQYNNVNIGEIWVMSGQSNASLFSGHLEDVNELALLSETLNIREFTSNGYSLLPDAYGNGTWKTVTAAVVKEKTTYAMSALGYATVARLSAELGPDVPVGLITLAQGSTKISTWIDYEHLEELSPWLADRYDSYKAQGSLPSNAHGSAAVSTILYNRHVYPLEGFTAAGVLWYQGCGDIPGKYYKSADAGASDVHYLGPEGSTYTEFFTALEEVYRRAFDNSGTDLPFYVMQLAPYSRSGDGPSDGSYIYQFRLEQYEMCQKLDNTYLVSIANEGMAFTTQDINGGAFIHPARKSPVGNRTADMILANQYGIKRAEVVSYPQPISAVRNGDGTVTITFDTDLKISYGDAVEGFELSSNGSTWVKAKGTIDGNKLTLSASGVSGAVQLRYGFGRTQVELASGRVIEIAHATGQYELNDAKTEYNNVKDSLTGELFTIKVDSNDTIRSKNHGNLTNDSGVPMVLFSMSIVAG